MWPFSRYISVSSKGILQGMTDCHSHLLPGVDDGVRTAEESLRILEEMERQGIRKLWLTPHIMEDIPNTTDALKTRFRTLCESYRGNIRLELAAEYMLDNLCPAFGGRRYSFSTRRKTLPVGGNLLFQSSYEIAFYVEAYSGERLSSVAGTSRTLRIYADGRL